MVVSMEPLERSITTRAAGEPSPSGTIRPPESGKLPAAVRYVRSVGRNNRISCDQVMGKKRVASGRGGIFPASSDRP
jgi:hypothetical protein